VAKGGFDKSGIEPICPAIFGHSDYTECCQGERRSRVIMVEGRGITLNLRKNKKINAPEITGAALVIPGFAICILALRALGTSWQGKVFGTDFRAGSGEDLAISRRVSHPGAAFMRSF